MSSKMASGMARDPTHSSLSPILGPCQLVMRTPQCGNTLPPITDLQVPFPRHELQRNYSFPYAPYDWPPATQRSSPPQQIQFTYMSPERSPDREYQSAMQEAYPAPPLLHPYQTRTPMPFVSPVPVEYLSRAKQSGNQSMHLSSIPNEIPTKPLTALFSLHIRQQPVAARVCGNGLKDRRYIDPPPIVELILSDQTINLKEINKYLVTLHCFLFVADSDEEARLTSDGDLQLIGAQSVNHHIGPDDNNNIGCFFIFGDLSCRSLGEWRLKFRLEIKHLGPEQACELLFVAECFSDVFLVSEPTGINKFRGMSKSTPLTRALKDMGGDVKLRNAHKSRAPENHP